MDFLQQLTSAKETFGIDDNQVANIAESLGKTYGDHVAELKQGWDGKANENANKIIDGAAANVEKLTGIPLNNGEKKADYLSRVGVEYVNKQLETEKSEVARLKSEYDQKLKGFDGNPEVQKQLADISEKYDTAQKRLAELEGVEEYKGKYEELQGKYQTLNLETAFSAIKPAMKEGLNAYEFNARWNELKDSVLKDWNIVMVDGQPTGISKENQHKQKPLKELMTNEEFEKFLGGRTVPGSGAKPADLVSVEGVPFKIGKDASTSEISKAIRDYLATQNISKQDARYAEQFASMMKKIQKRETA